MSEVMEALVGQTIRTIPIKDIQIEHRQRTIDPKSKEFKDWAEHVGKLADSIKRVGLLHPVTLEDGTNTLIAGFNRIQAFLKLGRTEIPFVYRSELTDMDRKILELEENIQRLDLSFADKVKAIAEIDALQRMLASDKGEAWTTAKTAEMVGVSVGTVSQAKKVVEAATKDPSLFNASGLVAALNKIKVGEQLEKRKKDLALRDEGRLKTFPAEILTGDALELIKGQPDESFDAVITNFPFGIELTLGKEGDRPYHDSEDYIVKLVRAVTHEAYRVLRPDSWMLAWFDVRKITYSNKQRRLADLIMKMTDDKKILELAAESLGLAYWMEEAGFDYVQLLPAIWYKPNKTQGMIGDPNKGMIMAYEAFVLAGKGNPVLMKKGRQNIFGFDTPVGNEREISVQMPTSICAEVVSMTCMGGSRILDPFAGSGAVGLGALENQCSFVGFELDPRRAEVGNIRLREHGRAKPETTPEDPAERAAFAADLRDYAAQRLQEKKK